MVVDPGGGRVAPARKIPEHVRALSNAFVAELEQTLGLRFVGLFQYGAVCFPPSPISDFDAHVIVSDPFTDTDRDAINAMRERLLALQGGDDMDVWYVTLDAMRSRDLPQTELRPGFLDESWGLHRAHWHAGRIIVVKGPDPRELVPEPTWEEIDEGLQGELEFVTEHLADAPAYGVLNLCRILYSYETRDVVVGKFQSATWAHAALDVDWHPLIRTALAAYADKTYTVDADIRPFYEAMSKRIEAARA